MPRDISYPDLYPALERHCKKIRKPRSAILFRRGEKSTGIFVIYSGAVVLDFGVDGASPFSSKCSQGALLGLPATLVRGNYSMTATVGDDAEVGFLPTSELFNLLREHPELYKHLIEILSDKVIRAREAIKTSRASIDQQAN